MNAPATQNAETVTYGGGAEVDDENPGQDHNVVKSTHKYDVYGSLRPGSTGTSTSNHKFVGALGHTTEADTGLVYMRARYYDPSVGRFINEDPGRNGANWYAYCEGNPTNRVDANGRWSWQFDLILFTIGKVIDPPFTELVIAASLAVVAVAGFAEGVALWGMTAGAGGIGNTVIGGSAIVGEGAREMFAGLSVKMTEANGWLTVAINASGATAVIFNTIGIIADALAFADIVDRAFQWMDQ